ncbi:MAG: hypothetical protein AAGG50_06765, partial [Bacteroidota bacterium]
GASYRFVEANPSEGEPSVLDGESDRVRSGIGWLRLGLNYDRPSFQVAPHLAIPLVVWGDVQGVAVRSGPRPNKVRVGLQVTLR